MPNDSRPARVKWACNVLAVDLPNPKLSERQVRDRAIGSFFDSLNSNDFYIDGDSATAVDVLCGNPVSDYRCLKHQSEQQFRRLDETISWFALQLGVTAGPQLLQSLKARLASLSPQDCSADVQRYSKEIWSTAQYVDTQVGEENAAVEKIRQAIFHISTVRQTQRCRVRGKWVQRLKNKFSKAELAAVKRIVKADKKRPGNQFHRPFLFLLTQQEDQYEDFRIVPKSRYEMSSPLRYVGGSGPHMAMNSSRSLNASSTRLRWFCFWMVVFSSVCIFISTKARQTNSNPYQPYGQFEPDLSDEKTRNFLKIVSEAVEDGRVKQAPKRDSVVDAASEKLKPSQEKNNSSSMPNWPTRPARSFPGITKPSQNPKLGPDQLQPRSPLNPRPGRMP